MPRMCLDCGIPAWSDCVCDADAGLDHPRVSVIYAPRSTFASVNGSACHPKDGDPGAAPQGLSCAPAADPSCAEPSGAHDRATGRTAAPDAGDDPRVPQRAGVQPSTLAGEGRAAHGERHAPSPAEQHLDGGLRS